MIAIISFTKIGNERNRLLLSYLRANDNIVDGFTMVDDDVVSKANQLERLTKKLAGWTREAFQKYRAIIFIGASGIAVRAIAPFIKDKFTDPAVIVIDEKGQYVIPILSGHVGGANELAIQIATFFRAVPVITTATDVQNRFAVDVFAVKNNLVITDRQKAKKISADILENKEIGLFLEEGFSLDRTFLPQGLYLEKDFSKSRIALTYRHQNFGLHKMNNEENGALVLTPKQSLWIGIGCKRGTPQMEIEDALLKMIADEGILQESIVGVASIDLKANERGILDMCREYHWPFYTFTVDKLRSIRGDFSVSEFVYRQIGVDNVCERAAICAAGTDSHLIVRKSVAPGITLAVAAVNWRIEFE